MTFITLTPHHRTILTLLPIIKVRRATNALYKNPHSHAQSSMQPPGFQYRALYNPPPPHPPPQPISNLESLMEHFIVTQTKTNEALGESINQLTSKFDTMASHQKAMDTQITQIAQQISHLSRPKGHLTGQYETNPKGHINVVSMLGVELKESPVIVHQEIVSIHDSIGTEGKKEEGSLNSIGKITPVPTVRPYQPLVFFLREWHGLGYLSLSCDSHNSWMC